MDPAALLASAEELAASGEVVPAARAYGAAMSAALSAGDVEAQGAVRESLISKLTKACGGAREGARMREAIRALAASMPKKLNGALLSRGALCHWSLREALSSGDLGAIEALSLDSERHAKLPNSGAYADAMAEVAAALLLAHGGDDAGAAAKLDRVLAAASAPSWPTTSLLVATDAAASHLGAGHPEQATAALDAAAKIFAAAPDRQLAQRWREVITKRLAGADDAVLAPYRGAVEPVLGSGGSASAAGGRGGAGGAGGSSSQVQRSKVGQAWKRLSKSKPFVTVTRKPGGYEIRQSFDRDFRAVHPYSNKVSHHDDGGITLSFWEGGVRLYMVDMRGIDGQPGESSSPHTLHFFTPLAMGETWGVNRKGIVTIK